MFYTDSSIDRADRLRKDPAALAELRRRSSTRLIPIWNGLALVNRPEAGGETAMTPLPASAPVPTGDDIFLGLIDDEAYFAINCNALSEVERDALIGAADTSTSTDTHEFSDLRLVGPLLPAQQGSLLAYARGLVYWQHNSRYCSRCGSSLCSDQGGHMRRCSNTDCRYIAFPRTDPAVIMLVTRPATDDSPERCLLGRSAAWPNGVFSTLAGFVEPGESLEQGVQREVFEEAGIKTTNVLYVASQPWPFPRSIMLGFRATATSFDINIDPAEIADARWFSRSELAEFGTWGDEQYEFQMPRTDSIARHLIDLWRQEGDDGA